MHKPYMTLSEYIIRPDLPVPLEVMDKIYKYHAFPVSYVRHLLGSSVIVSRNSGYRPEEHELSMGRTPTSEHIFKKTGREGSDGYGAADYRTDLSVMGKFVKLLAEHTSYTRLCFYPEVDTPFIHADYRFYGKDTSFHISRRNSWHPSSLEEITGILSQIRTKDIL